MLYIRQVRVQAPGTTNQHIIDVRYSHTTSAPLTVMSRDAMVAVIDDGSVVYTHNDSTGAEALVVTRVGANGRKYITTMADGRETNNLLDLPRFI